MGTRLENLIAERSRRISPKLNELQDSYNSLPCTVHVLMRKTVKEIISSDGYNT